jgi:hypothetical protein
LDINQLKTAYSITAAQFELTEVMRQSLESGILFNATGEATTHKDNSLLSLFRL